MVSARSTVSMARTTPAQKPLGEQSTILRSGFGSGLAAMERSRERIGPRRRRGKVQFQLGLGTGFGSCQGTLVNHCTEGPKGPIYARIPAIDDHRLRLEGRAKRKGDLP